jgi:hypothetical protein
VPISLSRRRFVARGTTALGGLATGVASHGALAAPAPLPVFRLEACASCAACNACRRHAENKRFVSAEAADGGRAHDGCNCGIVQDGTLSQGIWVALFGPVQRPTRLVVDRRQARVAALLGA